MDLSGYRQNTPSKRHSSQNPQSRAMQHPSSSVMASHHANQQQQPQQSQSRLQHKPQSTSFTSQPALVQSVRNAPVADWSESMRERVVMRRKQAADLMEGVLEERSKPVFALTRWPQNEDNDLSLDVAYHILWHHEADEDNQQQEVFYMDAQLELMSQVVRFLSQGKPLPEHFLSSYSPDMVTTLFKERTFFQELGMMGASALSYFQVAFKQCLR